MATAAIYTDVVFEPKAKVHAKHNFQFGYRPSLDGLRAIAVLVVMATHAYVPFFGGGRVGVDVFFVLSGFLITGLLLEEWSLASRICLRSFYVRRALRLLPALLALLSVSEVFAVLRLRGEYFWTVQKAIVGTLLYVANWMRAFNSSSLGPIPHTWSLSVEEQFYILWPPILLLLLPRLRKSQIFLLLMLVALIVAFHRFTLWTGEGAFNRIYHGSDTRFDALLIGCAAAVAFANGWFQNRIAREVIRYASIPSALFVGSLVVRPLSDKAISSYGWPLIEFSVATLICYLVSSPQQGFVHRMLELRPLVWIGKISYGLYLWHVPIFSKMGWLQLPNLLRTCLMFAVSFAVAVVSYRFIEKPFLGLKSRMKRHGNEHSRRQRRFRVQSCTLPAKISDDAIEVR